ncbi:glyoxalase [Flavilitoribacter nigricans]|uniref:Glyoxalase n=1 Tax=Flavilitoribacter nigricans (strain ATCC 23147 / DSM 23189 / NBRC 102662 / NCIMB 1420 / SS-2) TaxID=1122177 RepID=A0A2D0N2F3_FLAN2|nr:glyoxalase [Flavilitoribacter nigricans]PHN02675.1 glyoxalase [Flavilitoribacter nigricans DSM 23189 = NBRC 102662]
MTDRKAIKDLRPEIPAIVASEDYSSAEQFQNECLRPILKFQHELLVAVFQHYIGLRKNKYYELTAPKKQEYIEHSIRQDRQFRNLLIGIILGHFTREEYADYLADEKELRRRLTDLLVQRLQSVSFDDGSSNS